MIGVFLTQNQTLQVVSYGIFHRCAKKISAFKVDLITPRIVELCLDFILLIVREVFVVKHIYIYIKKCLMRNQDYRRVESTYRGSRVKSRFLKYAFKIHFMRIQMYIICASDEILQGSSVSVLN